jgi:Zn-dependent protease
MNLMPELTLIQELCIWALPILLAITLHEVAHGYTANYLGDNTAKMYGRLSFNPIHHIDMIGTIILPLVIGALTHFNFLFGYAKPVPINWNQLKNPKRDIILVALAGPLANIIMSVVWAGILKCATMIHPESSMPALFLLMTARAGIIVNLILAFFNLIPLPPLDGSRIVLSFLSPQQALFFVAIEPYSFIILTLLAFSGLLGYVLSPLINGSLTLLSFVYNL